MHIFFLKGINLVVLCLPMIWWLERHLEVLLSNSLITVLGSVLAVVETLLFTPVLLYSSAWKLEECVA